MSALQPNLKEYTKEESVALCHKWVDLEEQGLFEEAEKVRREVPMLPGLANNLKREIGVKAMIEMGVNLSEAVKEYGYEWLEQ